jgi:outer membrane protein TolC
VRQGDVENRQKQLDMVQSRLDDGLGSPGDVVRARAALASAMSSLVDAQNSRAANAVQLAIQLGVNAATPLKISAGTGIVQVPEPSTGELPTLVQQALTQRPEVKNAAERVRSATYALDAAKHGQSPSITANVNLNGSGTSSPGQRGTTTYGVQMSWALGDSGRNRGRIAEAEANQRQEIADMEALKLTVSQDVISAWVDVQTLSSQVTLQEVALANAMESVRISQGRYSDGIGTFLEVTDAQASLLQAQLTLLNARNDLARARTRLAWATATPWS